MTHFKDKLSVVVPVFNVELYVERCIVSVLNQTFSNLELILVDDGSTDESGDICERWAEKDARVIVVHLTNCGVSNARNVGMHVATGDYVAFADADDYVCWDMYARMIHAMQDVQADIVCCNWNIQNRNGFVENNRSFPSHGRMNIEEFAGHIFDMPITIGGCAWNKLFKREMVAECFDERLSICEDTVFVARYCSGVHAACVIDEHFYTVVSRPNSATRVLGIESQELAGRLEAVHAASDVSPYVRNKAEAFFLDRLYGHLRDSSVEKSELNRFLKYYCDNRLRIMRNNQIFWKTKLLYLFRFRKAR